MTKAREGLKNVALFLFCVALLLAVEAPEDCAGAKPMPWCDTLNDIASFIPVPD